VLISLKPLPAPNDGSSGSSLRRSLKEGPDQYSLSFTLTPADTGRFAALTSRLSGLPSPRDQLAIIIGGRVVAHPAVGAAMHSHGQITGLASRAQAEHLRQSLRSG
jgi:preprotein translocase subunit SecD